MSPNRSKSLFLLFLFLLGLALFFYRNRAERRSPVVETGRDSARAPRAPFPGAATSLGPAMTEPAAPTFQPGPGVPSAEVPSDFHAFTARVLTELPRKTELRKLTPAQAHEAPAPIREAAVRLGEVADRVARNPGLKPEALEFYQNCSLQEELPDSIRALCLNRALRLYAELHHAVWPFDRRKMSQTVIDLAKRL